VILSLIGKHDEFVTPRAQLLHGIEILQAEAHVGIKGGILGGHGDTRPVLGRQLVPVLAPEHDFVGRRRLMIAGEDDVFGDLVIAELVVGRRRDELGAVDDPALERGVNIRRRQHRRRGAERLQDVGPRPGGADLHALEVVEAGDLAVRMQEDLGRRDTDGGNGEIAFVAAERAPQLAAFAVEDPVQERVRAHAAGEPGDDRVGRIGVGREGGEAEADVGDALLDLLPGIERARQHADAVALDLDLAVGQVVDVVDERLVIEVPRAGADWHVGGELQLCLRGRGGEAEPGRHRGDGRRRCQYRSNAFGLHVVLP
jgi:hypothetical protein